MYKETFNGNLITIEQWPSSTTEIKGKFSRSFNSLCNKSMKSLLNISSFSFSNSLSGSLTSIYSSSNDITNSFNNLNLYTSQGSLDIIEEEE